MKALRNLAIGLFLFSLFFFASTTQVLASDKNPPDIIAKQVLKTYNQAHQHARRHHPIDPLLKKDIYRRLDCATGFYDDLLNNKNFSQEQASLWSVVVGGAWIQEAWIVIAKSNRAFLEKKNRILKRRSVSLMKKSSNIKGFRIARSLFFQSRINRVYYQARVSYDSCQFRQEVNELSDYDEDQLEAFFNDFTTKSGILSFVDGPGNPRNLYRPLKKSIREMKKLGISNRHLERYNYSLLSVLVGRILNEQYSKSSR